jgi:hypothetical protein
MNSMPNEIVLFESESKRLILTTHRVRYQFESLGNAEIRSIMLEELASCTLLRSNNIIFLVLAGVCFILGGLVAAVGRDTEVALIIGILLSIVFVVIYFATRQQILALASSGTTIKVNTESMKLETAKQFIEQAEAAKNVRYLLAKGT